jgi:hypothetical protein
MQGGAPGNGQDGAAESPVKGRRKKHQAGEVVDAEVVE